MGAGATGVEEAAISSALLLFLSGLSLCLLLQYLVRKHDASLIPESALFILAGWSISFIFHWVGETSHQQVIDQYLGFRSELFFLCLLPIIVFESGFNMEKERFFRNIRGISILAFLGTLLTAAVCGLLLWACSALTRSPSLSLSEALIYGSIISATDVVSVLSTFRRARVDPNLYSLVFGESVLNDAVAITLFRALLLLRHRVVALSSVLSSLFLFLTNFAGSLSIGILTGVISSLTFKHIRLDSPDFEDIERALLLIAPCFSYMLAECLQMSGIVSILFCGLMTSTYNKFNLSDDSYEFFSQALRVASSLSEALVFVIFGFSMHSLPVVASQFSVVSIGLGCVAIFLSRFIACYPLCSLVNWRSETPLDPHSKFILLFSGLRGSMAYALSLTTSGDVSFGIKSDFFVTLTAAYVIISIFFKAALIGPLLRRWGMSDYSSIPEDEFAPAMDSEPGWGSLLRHGCSWGFLNEAYFRPFLVRDAAAERPSVLSQGVPSAQLP